MEELDILLKATRKNITDAAYIAWACRPATAERSRGIFFGDNPFLYSTPSLFAQISMCALISSFLQFTLAPLGQSAFFSMMLAGFLLGPSVWGFKHPVSQSLHPRRSYYVNETVATFGCMLFMFLVGSKMDITLMKRSGTKGWMIGLLNFVVPLILNTIVACIMRSSMKMGPNLHKSIFYIAVFQSVSSFHVIVCLLANLKLLNSKLGRLATPSSMVSGISSWLVLVLVSTLSQTTCCSTGAKLAMFFCAAFLFLSIFFILRPIMFRIIQNTHEGKPIGEGSIVGIFLMLLLCSFCSEFIGQHAMFGAIAFGIAVPDGPPLGSALVHRLDTFVTHILLPSFFVYSVSRINLFSVESENVVVVAILALSSFAGKVVGCMLPSVIFYKMPPINAFSLGLVMSSQGITDVIILQEARRLYLVDEQIYTIMVVSMVLISGISAPLLKALYNPFRQYHSVRKRTIEHANPNMELRMLGCIIHQDQTPSLIGLLEVSNPNIKSPICFNVIHMVELAGRLTPLLIHHRPGKRGSFHAQDSSHIINAFRYYERQSNGAVVVNLYTAISPFKTIHEEVCRIAEDKRISMMVVPFHKQWTQHGVQKFHNVRRISLQLLSKAPCSVGILVDRGTLSRSLSRTNTEYKIGVIFIHGKDDREALAGALRMSGHPNVSVTLIRVVESDSSRNNSLDVELDNDIITEFMIASSLKKHNCYREEMANDSVEMISLVRSLELSYDLILVGTNIGSKSPLLAGMTDWNEYPELGFLGDMLVSSDSKCQASVLAIQQHGSGVEQTYDNISYLSDYSSVIAASFRETSIVRRNPEDKDSTLSSFKYTS